MPATATDYAAFIDRLGLKYFKGSEFAALAKNVRKGVKNRIPEETLWLKIVPTLFWLDAIRGRVGKPISPLSVYRSPAYNTAVGGEPASFHMRHMACDFACEAISTKELLDAAKYFRGKKIALPGNAGTWVVSGGVGYYPKQGFVHIDCRGYDANW